MTHEILEDYQQHGQEQQQQEVGKAYEYSKHHPTHEDVLYEEEDGHAVSTKK